jgi:hypothetical protein
MTDLEFLYFPLPRLDPGLGYTVSDWYLEMFSQYEPVRSAMVWKCGVMPEPNSGVKAKISISKSNLERNPDHVEDIVKFLIANAIASCEDYIKHNQEHAAS